MLPELWVHFFIAKTANIVTTKVATTRGTASSRPSFSRFGSKCLCSLFFCGSETNIHFKKRCNPWTLSHKSYAKASQVANGDNPCCCQHQQNFINFPYQNRRDTRSSLMLTKFSIFIRTATRHRDCRNYVDYMNE